jgi:hypothetical protein
MSLEAGHGHTGRNPRPRPKARPWAPLDGRIAGPGPHHRIDPAIGNDILIVVTPSVTSVSGIAAQIGAPHATLASTPSRH